MRALWREALDDCVKDLRYGLRLIRNQPGFAVVSALTLALGVGLRGQIGARHELKWL